MKVGIIGAGGHSRTLINLLELNKIDIQGVYDDNFQDKMRGELVDGYPLIGGLDKIDSSTTIIIAKGDVASFEALSIQYQAQLLKDNLIHPKALIESLRIGSSNQISAFVYITKSAQIGSNNVIYTNSAIEHEVVIGNFNIITMNVNICGRVKIGNSCFFGASSTVLPKVSICDNVTIGAGAVVTKDIKEAGTYVGCPAKRIGE